MRIDLVITELDTGGAEKCCAELALFLQQREHCVRVIALGPHPKPPKDTISRLLETNQVDVHFLGGNNATMLPQVVSKLRQLLKRNPPDLVQSFLWHANTVSAWVVPSMGIPLFCGVRVAEPRRLRHWVDRWSTRRSNKTICVSQGVADWCIKTEKMDAKKLVVIPNGVVIQTSNHSIDPNSHTVPMNARILLFVGRLEHQKGIDVLADRGRELLRKLPEHHLVVIGAGSMRPLLDAMAEKPELRGRVHCLGQRNDVRAWMARSEMLLLPTRYEGMPNVILEAMAEGLPVVCTRVEGVSELLGDQLEEQAAAKDDWPGFFQKAETLARSQELCKKIGEANRALAISEFALDKQLLRYESLWTLHSQSRHD